MERHGYSLSCKQFINRPNLIVVQQSVFTVVSISPPIIYYILSVVGISPWSKEMTSYSMERSGMFSEVHTFVLKYVIKTMN